MAWEQEKSQPKKEKKKASFQKVSIYGVHFHTGAMQYIFVFTS